MERSDPPPPPMLTFPAVFYASCWTRAKWTGITVFVMVFAVIVGFEIIGRAVSGGLTSGDLLFSVALTMGLLLLLMQVRQTWSLPVVTLWEDGIECSRYWGPRQHVNWSAIESVHLPTSPLPGTILLHVRRGERIKRYPVFFSDIDKPLRLLEIIVESVSENAETSRLEAHITLLRKRHNPTVEDPWDIVGRRDSSR